MHQDTEALTADNEANMSSEEAEGSNVTTLPIPSSDLRVVEEKHALFFSAKWSLAAYVNGDEFSRSDERSSPHTPAETTRWARHLLRTHKWALRNRGVNVYREYVSRGGDPDDLEEAGD